MNYETKPEIPPCPKYPHAKSPNPAINLLNQKLLTTKKEFIIIIRIDKIKISKTRIIDIKPIIFKDHVMQVDYTVIFSFSLRRYIIIIIS